MAKSETEIGDAKVAILKGVLAEEAKSGDFGQNGKNGQPAILSR